ncbi:MAG: hypothetical protein NTZ26_04705 [Candidatus Aminicenantes bacterium]|nr:hypothetical protein [Candidatus Aminicenantes bacterium]
MARLVPWAAILAALVLGLWNLGGWLMNDDEGTYLYGAWRVSLGEMPYRDFALVQTPLAFGVVGGLFRLAGPSVWAARAASYLFMLGAAVVLFMAGRRFLHFPHGVALAGAGIFLLNKHVFFLGRSFLPDNLMLLGAAAMLYAALAAERASESNGAAAPTARAEASMRIGTTSEAFVETAAGAGGRAALWVGIFAGLAALAKLTGVFLFAGYGVFLAASMLRRDARRAAWGKAWRAVAGFGLSFGLPFGLMLAFVPGTFKYTLGFHLASGEAETGYAAGLVAARWGKLVGNHNYALFGLALVGVWAMARVGAKSKQVGRNSWRAGRDPFHMAQADAAKAREAGRVGSGRPAEGAATGVGIEAGRRDGAVKTGPAVADGAWPMAENDRPESFDFKKRQAWMLAAMAAAACLPVFLPGKYYLRYVLPAFLPLALFFAAGVECLIGRSRGDGGGMQAPTPEAAASGNKIGPFAASEGQGGRSAVPASRFRTPESPRGASVRRAGLRAVGGLLAAALILLCLAPTLSPAKIGEYDPETRALARLVEDATQPGQFVFGDDPFINFLAGRPCPPRLVDVSGAMVRGGWITSAVIEKACEEAGVALVFVERGHSAHHLAALPDADAFRAYLDRRFYLWRTVKREFLDVDIYLRKS